MHLFSAKILGVHVKGDVERVVGYGQTVFKDVPEKPYQVPLKTGTLYKNPKNHIALYETTEKLKLDKQKAESVILASKEYKIGDKCVIIKPTVSILIRIFSHFKNGFRNAFFKR